MSRTTTTDTSDVTATTATTATSNSSSDNTAPRSAHCAFWLTKKRKHCPHPVTGSEGKRYCGHHRTINRVQCEYCRTLVHDHHYDTHLTVCPNAIAVREQRSWPFYRQGVNAQPVNVSDSSSAIEWSSVDVDALICKLRKALVSLPPLESYNFTATDADSGSQIPLGKKAATRHIAQADAIIDVLESRSLVDGSTCVIEMGAGKALLGHVLTQRQSLSFRSLVLIDNTAFKRTAEASAANTHRYRIDISDVYLAGLPQLNEGIHALLIGKHLCGVAMDWSVHAAVAAINEGRTSVSGLAIATCCHHRCDYHQYANRSYLTNHTINAAEFSVLAKLSHWATIDTDSDSDKEHRRRSDDCHEDSQNDSQTDNSSKSSMPPLSSFVQSSASLSAMSAVERVSLGRSIKHFLDCGRLLVLRDKGFRVSRLEFTNARLTRENCLCLMQR